MLKELLEENAAEDFAEENGCRNLLGAMCQGTMLEELAGANR
jgi:hypothetical protein